MNTPVCTAGLLYGAKVETRAWEAITPISVEVPFEKQDKVSLARGSAFR